MRALVIDAEAQAKIAHLIEHAEQHHYHPEVDPVPGDDPAFVVHLNTYRVVFTFTVFANTLWRHLSVSVPAERAAKVRGAYAEHERQVTKIES
jgi:hypothetical protein